VRFGPARLYAEMAPAFATKTQPLARPVPH
jgi:hypothetical protein